MKEAKTLHLTLSKKAFEVMVTGEKKQEFRKGTDWIRTRLFDKKGNRKHYDFVRLANGYRKDSPYFIAKFEGFIRFSEDHPIFYKTEYTNGLVVEPLQKGDFIILLGEIIETGNLKTI